MKIISRSTFYQGLSMLGSRKSITLLLLICFLNTILFPAICYPAHFYKKIDFGQAYTKSFTEYLIEDCLDIDKPVSNNQKGDIDDIIKTTEDIDLIVHFDTTPPSLISSYIGLTYINSDSCIVHTFLGSFTPPPEYFL